MIESTESSSRSRNLRRSRSSRWSFRRTTTTRAATLATATSTAPPASRGNSTASHTAYGPQQEVQYQKQRGFRARWFDVTRKSVTGSSAGSACGCLCGRARTGQRVPAWSSGIRPTSRAPEGMPPWRGGEADQTARHGPGPMEARFRPPVRAARIRHGSRTGWACRDSVRPASTATAGNTAPARPRLPMISAQSGQMLITPPGDSRLGATWCSFPHSVRTTAPVAGSAAPVWCCCRSSVTGW